MCQRPHSHLTRTSTYARHKKPDHFERDSFGGACRHARNRANRIVADHAYAMSDQRADTVQQRRIMPACAEGVMVVVEMEDGGRGGRGGMYK